MTDRDRIDRMASRIRPHGRKIADTLLSDAVIDQLVAVADQGLPPVVIAHEVLPREVLPALGEDNVRRFVGAVVRVALARRHRVVDRLGARVPGESPFRTGAVYKHGSHSAEETAADLPDLGLEDGDDLLDAMIAGLSPDQRRALIARIEASLT